MHTTTAAELIEQLAADRSEISRLMTSTRLQPFLGAELTLHQLRIVLLVATHTATTACQIADRMYESEPVVLASVDKLVELGYLEQVPSDSERRVENFSSTATGVQVYEHFFGLRDISEEFFATFDLDDLRSLAQGTGALQRALQQHLGFESDASRREAERSDSVA